MPSINMDGRMLQVPPGTTLLEAAKQAGIPIPTLCHYEGMEPHASCMVCVVLANPGQKLVPACATIAQEGMTVQTNSPPVHEARRVALELLLSDHTGDCEAPCQRICPTHMDIPLMIHHLAQEQPDQAIITIKRDIALPAVLGYICPAPCEKGCRRHDAGGALSVCQLKRFAAEKDLQSSQPYTPACDPPTGKRVGVVGSGPAGLAAAYHLAQYGHQVQVFDAAEELGGALRVAVRENRLPGEILDGEIAAITRMGVKFRTSCRLGADLTLAQLQSQHDAVLLTVGPANTGGLSDLGAKGQLVKINHDGQTVGRLEPWLFLAGGILRAGKLAVRSVAEGKAAAWAIHQYLQGEPLSEIKVHLHVSRGKLTLEQLEPALAQVSATDRLTPEPEHGFTDQQAQAEAQRCLQCGCLKNDKCRLRDLADQYKADPHRFTGTHRELVRQVTVNGLVYEPGKCIDCGLCVQIAVAEHEPLGLAMVGRGFQMRPGVPLEGQLKDALLRCADLCVRACPTGALAWNHHAD